MVFNHEGPRANFRPQTCKTTAKGTKWKKGMSIEICMPRENIVEKARFEGISTKSDLKIV
jgi:hypothetical protein